MTYDLRVDMPASFGPSAMPPVSRGGTGLVAGVSFTTTREALADLLPPFYELVETPRVQLSYSRLDGVDWLGGRSYSLVAVNIPVVFRGAERTIKGPFAAVVWEDDTNSIIAGRDYLGIPKLYADIPDVAVGEESFQVGLSLYGTELLSISFGDMKPESREVLAHVNEASATWNWLGWKHVPGTPREGATVEPDASYPTMVTQGSTYDQMWTGTAEIKFNAGVEDIPITGRIIRRLSEIPILEVESASAFRVVDRHLDRSATVRLQ
jgi:acetoacetate decarboxylase